MKRITIYNDYYRDDVMATYNLNTIEVKELVESLLSGTNFDILITNKEDL